MNSEFLSCPVCLERYNQSNHLPRMITTCGHTLCTSCLTSFINSSIEMNCPLDDKKMPPAKSVDAYPINFIINQLLEGRVELGMCKVHHEEPRFICMTDKQRICDNCIWEGQHEDHKVEAMKAVQIEADKKKKEIESIVEDLDACYKEIDEAIERKRSLFLKSTKEKFDDIRSKLDIKEIELNTEINNMFDLDNDRLNNVLGNASVLRKTMRHSTDKLTNVFKDDEFLQNENFFSEIDQEIAKSAAKINSDILEDYLQDIRTWLQEMSQSFETSLKDQIKLFNQFEPSFIEPTKTLMKFFSDQSAIDSKWGSQIEVKELKVFSRFSLNASDNYLYISNTNPEPCQSIISLENLGKIKQVKLEIHNNCILETADIQTLGYAWKKFKQQSSLEIKFNPGTISLAILQELVKGASTLSRLTFDLKGVNLANQDTFIRLMGKVISAPNKLLSLAIILDNAIPGNNMVTQLFSNIDQTLKNLEEFTLSLNNTNITENELSQALSFARLLRVKQISLQLKNTLITNATLDALIYKTLKPSQFLEKLHIDFEGTQITDFGLQELFLALSKDINSLEVNVGMTKVTNISLESISKSLQSKLAAIQELSLSFQGTTISDIGVLHLSESLPEVSSLILNLDNTSITDKGVEPFTGERFKKQERLKEFKLSLENTGVSNEMREKIKDLLNNFSL